MLHKILYIMIPYVVSWRDTIIAGGHNFFDRKL